MAEINCDSCCGACCKGPNILDMTLEEAAFMIRCGNKLITIEMPTTKERKKVTLPIGVIQDSENSSDPMLIIHPDGKTLKANHGRYLIREDCANLETTEGGKTFCSVYDQRPQTCRDYEMGGTACRSERVSFGVDEPSEEFPRLEDSIDPTLIEQALKRLDK